MLWLASFTHPSKIASMHYHGKCLIRVVQPYDTQRHVVSLLVRLARRVTVCHPICCNKLFRSLSPYFMQARYQVSFNMRRDVV